MAVKLDGTDIKQILTGLRESQIEQLEKVCAEIHRPRSEIIREAIDLWLRGFAMQQIKDVQDG